MTMLLTSEVESRRVGVGGSSEGPEEARRGMSVSGTPDERLAPLEVLRGRGSRSLLERRLARPEARERLRVPARSLAS